MAKTVIIQCTMCMGTGEITERDHYRGRYYTNTRECMVCRGSGERVVTVEAAEPVETPAAATITYCGQPVNAPGFTQASFTRAMARAFGDDLQVAPCHDGRHIVHHRGLTGGYLATRTSCDCPAGRAGVPCKHRSFLIAHLDIREPHIRREWAKLNRERPIRKAVAA